MQDIMQGFRADQLIVLALVFVAAFGTVLGVLYVFSPDRMRGRMEQIASETGTVPGNAGQQQAWVEKLVKWAQPVSRLSLPKEGRES